MFTEYMLAHWAGFDFSRPLTERRDNLMLALELRDALGIGRKKPRRKAKKLPDPILSELERVERSMGIIE